MVAILILQLFLVLILSQYTVWSRNKGEVKCTIPVDVAFLLDFSTNIGHKNSLEVRKFLREAVVAFNLSKGGTRAAVLLYSNDGSIEIPFHYFSNVGDFGAAVDRLPLQRWRNRVTVSFLKAHDDLFGLYATARDNVPKIALMITDGLSRRGENYVALKKVASSIRKAGVHFLLIGIGNQINETQLLDLVEGRTDLMLPKTFNNLTSYIEIVVQSTCKIKVKPKPSLRPRCSAPTDIAFIIDSSTSIGLTNFQKLKLFVKKTVLNFHLSPTAVRVAVVLYSNAASTRIWFDDFLDADAFGMAVKNLPYEPGGNLIDLALENAYTNLFGPHGNSRTNAAKFAVVLIGGLQSLTPFSVTLDIASYPLQTRGVRIIAVGIGNRVDDSELQLMVKNRSDLLLVRSFDHLRENIKTLTELLCTIVSMEGPTMATKTNSLQRSFITTPTVMTRASFTSPSSVSKESLTSAYQTKSKDDIDRKRVASTFHSATNRVSVTAAVSFNDSKLAEYVLSADTDILFLLDASKDVTTDNYRKQKLFVESLSRCFGISTKGPRASVLFYSDNAFTLFTFTEYDDVLEFNERLEAAPLLGQSKRLENALLLAYEMFSQLGRQGPKVVILFVNAVESFEPNVQSVKQALKPLIAISAKIYIIAPGSLNITGVTVLDNLVTRPDDVMFVSFNKDLQFQVKAVAEHVHLTYEVLSYSEPLKANTEILFFLDSSRSVSSSDYEKQKRFVKTLIQIFQMKDNSTRAGLIIYGSSAKTILHPQNYTNTNDFNYKLYEAPRIASPKRLFKALQLGTRLFSNRASSGPKIAFLLISGEDEVNGDRILLKTAKYSMASLGVNVYIVAIGSSSNRKTLRKLVARPGDLTMVDSYERLATQVQTIARHVHSTYGLNYPLSQTSDVIFVMDASSSVTTQNFNEQKLFIKSLTKTFRISSTGPRASVIVYSSDSNWIFNFNEFSSTDEFNRRIDAATLLGHSRRIDRALQFSFQMFSNIGRPGPKVLVLFAFGKESIEPGSKPLEEAIKPLRNIDVKTYVIAVGDTAIKNDLMSLVETSENLFIVQTYQMLQNLTRTFSKAVFSSYVSTQVSLPATPKQQSVISTAKISTPKPTSYVTRKSLSPDTDVMFILDASQSMSQDDFENTKTFVKRLVRGFQIKPNGTFHSGPLVCVIMYSSNAYLVSNFTQYDTIEEFEERLDSVALLKNSSNMDKAFHLSHETSASSSSRYKISILITTGQYGKDAYVHKDSILSFLQRLRDLNTKLYIILTGGVKKRRKLNSLVKNPEDIFVIPSTDELHSVVNPVVEHITNTYDTPISLTIFMDIVFLIDTSVDVAPEEFLEQVKLVSLIVEKVFGLRKDVRISVVCYGADAKVFVKLDQDTTFVQFITGINNSQFIGGNRRLDIAMHTAQQQFHSVDKPVSKRLLITFLSGKQATGALPLRRVVEPFKDLGIRMYVVVTKMVQDYGELTTLVAESGNIYRAPSFLALPTIVKQLESDILSEVTNIKPKTTTPLVQHKSTNASIILKTKRYQKTITQPSRRADETSATTLKQNFIETTKDPVLVKTLELRPNGLRTTSLSTPLTDTTIYSKRFSTSTERPLLSSRKFTVKSKQNQLSKTRNSLLNTIVKTKTPHWTRELFKRTITSPTNVATTTAPRVAQEHSTRQITPSDRYTESFVTERSGVNRLQPSPVSNISQTKPVSFSMEPSLSTTSPNNRLHLMKSTEPYRTLPVLATVSSQTYSSLPSTRSKQTPAGVPMCTATLNIAFLLDASGSVGTGNFQKEKQFVKAVLSELNVESRSARVAIVAYSDLPEVVVTFNEYSNSNDFNNALDNIKYVGRTSRMDKALYAANTDLFTSKRGMRLNTAKVIVLLTDGRQSQAPDALPLSEVAISLRKKDIKLLAVGVGEGISMSELEQVTSSRSQITRVNTFDELLTTTKIISRNLCEIAEFKRCIKKLDIAVLVDSSGSMGTNNYMKQKEFVKAFARAFRISKRWTRVGIILYSDHAFVAKRFNEYFRHEYLARIIDDLPHRKGAGNLNKALRLAADELLTNEGGIRNGVYRIVIVITDNFQFTKYDTFQLGTAADRLLSVGARIIVVAVGGGSKENDLALISDDRENVMIIRSFSYLPKQVLQLAKMSCHAEDIKPCDNVLDIGLFIDQTISGSTKRLMEVLEFIRIIVKSFNSGSTSTRMALMISGTTPPLVIHLKSSINIERLLGIVRNLPIIEKRTDIEVALQVAVQQLFTREINSRRGIPRVLLGISGEKHRIRFRLNEGNKVDSLLNRLGVKLLMVAVGNGTNYANLRYLTQNDRHFFRSATYLDLKLHARRVSREMCEITSTAKCARMLDLCLMLDSSGMIGLRNYDKLKTFVKTLTYAFDISANKVQVGAILYSDKARVEIQLRDRYDALGLRAAIGDSPYLGKITRIDRALRAASDWFFEPGNGMRPAARKVVVLFTNGHQTRTFDSFPLRYAAAPLRQKKVKTFVVAIGFNALIERTLRSVVEKNDDILKARSFDLLAEVSERLVEKICGDDVESLYNSLPVVKNL